MKGLNKKIFLLKLKRVTSFCLLLTAYCLLAFTNSTYATIRYVSHEGSNTPPYLTWETAADSIMSAINISVFGDTIYVSNGVYKEQVIMIPGLTLIGAGMDSTIINTQTLVNSTGFVAVEVKDSCLFKGFHIIVYYNSDKGYGIAQSGNSLITLNKINSALCGIYVGWTGSNIPIVYENTINNVYIGISIFNSSSVISENIIYTNLNGSEQRGIDISAFDYSYTPVIYSNYIEVKGFSYTSADGIYKNIGASPIITNNTIILDGPQNKGIFLGDADTTKVYNNLIYAFSGLYGIVNYGIPHLKLYNNYVTGNIGYPGFYVIEIGPQNIVKNNVVTNTEKGVWAFGTENLIFQYNNVWNNDINYTGFTPDSTNLSVDPMVINEDSTQGELDFHLQKYSPLIDAGDPETLDKDLTRSDIGLYGGPFGERYQYIDLAPKPPRNLTAVVDSEYINLSWNSNTEADFNSYNLFRDTTANFTADSTTFVASLTDTFYVQIIPGGIDAFYYKLTATDNQGNESQPSEELAVIITSIKEYPTTVSNYRLYQNYPNPFNPSTKIGYKLKERGYVKLMVYDIKGELVEVLVNEFQDAGYHEAEFVGQLAKLTNIASGVYIYQIMVKNVNNIPVFSDMKKMVYLK